MSRSWDIIGWIILAAMAAAVLWFIVKCLLAFHAGLMLYKEHVKTRDTKPERNQSWMYPNGLSLRIGKFYDEKFEVCERGCTVISSPEEWKQRVEKNKLICLSPQ